MLRNQHVTMDKLDSRLDHMEGHLCYDIDTTSQKKSVGEPLLPFLLLALHGHYVY